jgi:hypothetical protein
VDDKRIRCGDRMKMPRFAAAPYLVGLGLTG